MKPQNMNDIKTIFKNYGIIIASNYFNSGKPQLFTYITKNKTKKYLNRVKSGKMLNIYQN